MKIIKYKCDVCQMVDRPVSGFILVEKTIGEGKNQTYDNRLRAEPIETAKFHVCGICVDTMLGSLPNQKEFL